MYNVCGMYVCNSELLGAGYIEKEMKDVKASQNDADVDADVDWFQRLVNQVSK